MEEIMQNKSGKGKKIAVVVIVLVIILAGGYALVKKYGNNSSQDNQVTVSPEVSATPSPTAVGNETGVKSFTVVGKNFSFSVPEIKVNQGDKVKITFKNENGFHDWVIDEFNTRTPRIQAGQTAEVEFVADKKGTFEYYCSVGEHRQAGMRGNLIVN